MNRELELRDKEIIDTFDALAHTSDCQEACAQETMKQTGCTYPRLRAAFEAIEDNPKHIYWKT